MKNYGQRVTYVDKGYPLQVALREAGLAVRCVDGIWYTRSDPSEVEAFISAFDGVSAARDAKKAEISAHAATLREKATEGYTPAEMASWQRKYEEARRYTVEPSSESEAKVEGVYLIWMEAQARGVTTKNIADRVKANGAALLAYEAAVAGTEGRHRDAVDAISEADDIATMRAIQGYDYLVGWP